MFTNQRWGYLLVALVFLGCAEKEPTTPTEILDHSFSIGDWNTTISLCEQMLAKSPNDTELLRMIGQAHLATQDYTAAVADFTKLIELQPDEPDPYYGRENAYKGLGETDLAYEDGQAGRKLDPLYESAYAYDMSNFVPQVDLANAPTPVEENEADESDDRDNARSDANESIAENSDNDSAHDRDHDDRDHDGRDHDGLENDDPTRTSNGETVVSDETKVEPSQSSRILTKDNSPAFAPRADANDIGIPKAPKIVMENRIPKLQMNGAGPNVPEADGGLAELQDIRIPAGPSADPGEEFEELTEKIIIPHEITTSLPTDEFGNYRFPNAPTGRLSTGLPNNLSDVEGSTARSPSGIAVGNTIATGLNAPFPDAGGAVNPITPSPGILDPKFGTVPDLGGINGPRPASVGYSGLPIPNGSTGLPTGPIQNTAGRRSTGGQTGFTPTGTQFHSNPIYGPTNQPVISTSIPGFPAPNSVAPPSNAAAPSPRISTSLSDTVLQNRLHGNNPQPTLKLRSIQP